MYVLSYLYMYGIIFWICPEWETKIYYSLPLLVIAAATEELHFDVNSPPNFLIVFSITDWSSALTPKMVNLKPERGFLLIFGALVRKFCSLNKYK